MSTLGHSTAPAAPSKWSSGLCEADGALCCITWCLPGITFGQIAEMVDEENDSCAAHCVIYTCLSLCTCHWLLSCVYREKLRSKYGLPSEPCCDCCMHFCCGPCALCQEHMELKSRGLDPSKGWIPPAPVPVAPPMPPSMLK